MSYKMYLVLGDYSNDGHNQSDKVLFEVNYPVEAVRQAYKDSCKLTGVSFNDADDYTGLNRHWREADKYHIATEYEEWEPSAEVINILSQYGIDATDGIKGDPTKWFVNLWKRFVALSLPDIEFTELDSDIPTINGYSNKDLCVQFGYGLYS